MTGWLDLTCENGGHWFIGNSDVCVCGASQISTTPQAATPPGPYGLLAGYKPSSQPKPARPEIPAHVREAAIEAGASHLSADGTRIFKRLFGQLLQAKFDGRSAESWWDCRTDIPGDAVKL
jgi:hypothetical protein